MQSFNYHTHTIHSDGRREPEAYIEEAIDLGLHTIGFSDHAPIPGYPTRWNMDIDKLDDYLQEINTLKAKYASQIRVLLSMEVDYVEGYVHPKSDLVKVGQLDYIIGSVHFVQAENGTLWDYEGSTASIQKGVETLFLGDVKKIIKLYYENMRKMAAYHTPDIIGHLDRIKVMNDAGTYFDETASWYQKEIDLTLEVIRDSGCLMEINTKGIYGRGHVDPYPSYWILKKAKNMGIPVHLRADAHAPEFLNGSFDEVMNVLHSIGYSNMHENGLMQFYL